MLFQKKQVKKFFQAVFEVNTSPQDGGIQDKFEAILFPEGRRDPP